MKRLYVTDLDGTLLNSDGSVSENSIKILNELIADGAHITYSTSHSYYTASRILKDVKFNLPCIVQNGAYVIDAATGDILRKNLLSHDIYNDILSMNKFFHLNPFIVGKTDEGEERLLYDTTCNNAQDNFIDERIARNDKRVCMLRNCPTLKEVTRIIFLYHLNEIIPLRDMIQNKYGDSISIKLTEDVYYKNFYRLEFSDAYANKGDMLTYLSKTLGVGLNNTTVFGDQTDDLEMFGMAGKAVAVNNAAEDVIKMADEIIASNDEDSVAKYIAEHIQK